MHPLYLEGKRRRNARLYLLTLSGEYHNRDEFRHIAAGGQKCETHYGIGDSHGIAENGHHPRHQIGRNRYPYDTHDERYRVPVLPSFVPAVRYGKV